jgi:hypothetical protein
MGVVGGWDMSAVDAVPGPLKEIRITCPGGGVISRVPSGKSLNHGPSVVGSEFGSTTSASVLRNTGRKSQSWDYIP